MMNYRGRELRLRALKKYGGKCCKCGFSDWRALVFDHVFNGGCADRRNNHPYSEKYFKRIIDNEKGEFQLLCANCDRIKRTMENKAKNGSCVGDAYLKAMSRERENASTQPQRDVVGSLGGDPFMVAVLSWESVS